MEKETAPFGLVWAEGRAHEIGAHGGMPWSLPEDLAHFARLTAGCAVVMGRRTWESLPVGKRPLPGRANVVLSSRKGFSAPGAITAHSLEEGLAKAAAIAPATWVIGGAGVFREALRLSGARSIALTEVDELFPEADSFAPDFRGDGGWALSEEGPWTVSESGLRHRFLSFRRV